MDAIGIVSLIGALLVSVTSISVMLIDRYRVGKTMRRLEEMIDATMEGNLQETTYDESMLSALEAKLYRYLNGERLSTQNLSQEKEKIKSLISDISHQTKTPIANILLYTQLLLEQEDLSPEHRMLAKEIGNQSEKLNFLVHALIKTSRLETGIITVTPKESKIVEMIDHVIRQASTQAHANDITVITELDEGMACFDPKWTTEALFNIVDNAIKYTPRGGKISIVTKPYEMFYRVDISDTGIGIEESDQSKIFSRFYRARNTREIEGVGIGLFLAREIISAQKGYIKVTSEIGRGSTFSVFLPK